MLLLAALLGCPKTGATSNVPPPSVEYLLAQNGACHWMARVGAGEPKDLGKIEGKCDPWSLAVREDGSQLAVSRADAPRLFTIDRGGAATTLPPLEGSGHTLIYDKSGSLMAFAWAAGEPQVDRDKASTFTFAGAAYPVPPHAEEEMYELLAVLRLVDGAWKPEAATVLLLDPYEPDPILSLPQWSTRAGFSSDFDAEALHEAPVASPKLTATLDALASRSYPDQVNWHVRTTPYGRIVFMSDDIAVPSPRAPLFVEAKRDWVPVEVDAGGAVSTLGLQVAGPWLLASDEGDEPVLLDLRTGAVLWSSPDAEGARLVGAPPIP